MSENQKIIRTAYWECEEHRTRQRKGFKECQQLYKGNNHDNKDFK